MSAARDPRTPRPHAGAVFRAGIALLIVALFSAVAGLQAARERRAASLPMTQENLLYVQSAPVLQRIALSFDALVADIYWLRTVQHYGRTKLSSDPDKTYDLLYPLLDLTTTLDPQFNVAYRFGALFLAEPFPGGPGRPDQAIALLEKGLHRQPGRWELAQDIGFIHYWWRQDYDAAAEWFTRASKLPGAPSWLTAVAAATLAEGGNRSSSRQLWQEVGRSAEADWLKRTAEQRLKQLDAMDAIDQLELAIETYRQRSGRPATGWADLVAAGLLRGVPIDPVGYPYQLASVGAGVQLDPRSPLNPLPAEPAAR